MPLFTYKAKNKNGLIVEETIQASTKSEAASFLKADGLQVLTIKSLDEGFTRWGKKISTAEKSAFCRFMATMLRSGLSLSEAAEIIKQETENARMKEILADIAFQTKKGKSLSLTLSSYKSDFDATFLTIIKSGEQSGTLEEAFNYLAKQLLNSYEFSQKIKGALIYPAVIIGAMFVVGTTMLVMVLPKIADVFLKMKINLPTMTRFIFNLGLFIGSHTFLFLLGLIVLFFLLFLLVYLENTRNKLIKLLTKFPPIKKMLGQIDLARFSRTLAILLKSGVSIIEALEVAADSLTQPQLKKQAKNFAAGLAKGKSLSTVLAEKQGYFPLIMIQTIRTGEGSGNLEAVLQELADFYEKEVEYQLKRLTTLIEPILMLLIGIVVGAMVILIIAPIYSVIGGLQESIKR